MNPQIWPALKDWKGSAGELTTRRAIYGKVHRAPTDYRWFAWSTGFGQSGPAPLEHDLGLGIEDEGASLYCWRFSSLGAIAVRCYPSRAFDAAGRPAVVEKQVLVADTANGLPPVALAFFLLPEATKLDDNIWWNTWRDPRWKSLDYHFTIAENDCPAIQTGDLETLLDRGVSELLDAVSGDSLAQFYSQLLSNSGLAVLQTKAAALTPLAVAALLLPLDRSATERISLAGGVLSTKLDPLRLSHWSGIACPPNVPAIESSPAAGRYRTVALDFVRKLERSISGSQVSVPPPDLSPGGNFLLGFLQSPERWFAPGKQGRESLAGVGPWPVVQREEEAIFLRQKVKAFIADVESRPPSPERKQLGTKADLLRALLLALCPGTESLEAVSLPAPMVVPALLFAGRIEVQDWHALSQYTPQEFQTLVDQSLRALPSLASEVSTWLETCANRVDTGKTQAYARMAMQTRAV